ncbi:MAG: gamma-glutamyltransferase [bacterium]|nr:gamma-glutamyltransferase [bacterium]
MSLQALHNRSIMMRAILCIALFLLPLASVGAELSFQRGAVTTASPEATAIGEQIFQQGGNAFDVAVAVGFALAVSYPQAGNIGGGGFALIRDARSGEIRALDFREVAPSAAIETMYLDSNANVIKNLSLYGAKAVGVPGTVAGLHELWKKYGKLPWNDLVQPAIELARDGLVIDQHNSSEIAEDVDNLKRYAETSRIFLPKGHPPRPGDTLFQPELAATLKLIADSGPEPFYHGKIAEQIVATMQKHGGLITREDLAGYQPIWRAPTHFTFDSLDIYSMPPPSSGGICVGQILKLLEPFDLSKLTSTSPEYIHLFCEAAKLAYADRSMHLGDPSFWNVPNLLDSGYVARLRARMNHDSATASSDVKPGNPQYESDQTTHYSVCDSAGNMVAITYTLNTSFGSCLVVDGAGFLLNNEMDDFSIKPGVPNAYGLIGGEANKVEPKKRMLSSMSPTLVLKQNHPYLILGSPGGSKIITTVAEGILNYVRFHRSPSATVAAPRFHHQWVPDTLYLEEASWAGSVSEEMKARGYVIKKIPAWCNLQLIAIDSSGAMIPSSDPRGNGKAGGW